jgi:uncharacterized protein
LWDVPKLRSRRRARPGLGIREVVGDRRGAIRSLAARHRAVEPRIFGSVARGEAGPTSDLDLVVRFEAGATLFDHVALERELTALLGRRVDVVNEPGLHWLIRPQVVHDAVAV